MISSYLANLAPFINGYHAYIDASIFPFPYQLIIFIKIEGTTIYTSHMDHILFQIPWQIETFGHLDVYS